MGSLKPECASLKQVRMVGIDDVKYASMLPVPLTTHHQNCGDIGSIAISAMLDRIERPRSANPRHFLQATS